MKSSATNTFPGNSGTVLWTCNGGDMQLFGLATDCTIDAGSNSFDFVFTINPPFNVTCFRL